MGQRCKRPFDLLLVLASLPFSLPLMGLIALWVLLDDRGPVLHSQTRIGLHGRPFRIHKFRTLRRGTERSATVAPEADPRITRAGRFLRRWRLDEWPQLYDVLRGEMSLVGPRPELPAHLRDIPAGLRENVHRVRPGVTGPAAVAFLAEDLYLRSVPDPEAVYCRVILPAKLRLERDYVDHWTFAIDIGLIAQTLASVFSPAARRRSLAMIERLAANAG